MLFITEWQKMNDNVAGLVIICVFLLFLAILALVIEKIIEIAKSP